MSRSPACAVLLVALVGCARPHRPSAPKQDPCTEAIARDTRARDGRMLSWVGLGSGTVMALLGFALAARGAEIRDMESSADSEGGIGQLLGGTLLGGAGVGIALTSAVGLAVYSRRVSDSFPMCTAAN